MRHPVVLEAGDNVAFGRVKVEALRVPEYENGGIDSRIERRREEPWGAEEAHPPPLLDPEHSSEEALFWRLLA